MNRFYKTNNSIAPLFLRLFLAIVLFPHGAQKMLGWFGGFGFEATMDYFVNQGGMPWFVGFLVILVEFFGPLALLIGFAIRFWSLAVFLLSIGIILIAHSEYFFMNWTGNQKSEGFQFFLLILGMCLALMITGGGKFSVDNSIYEKIES